jgi:hypothetical protein
VKPTPPAILGKLIQIICWMGEISFWVLPTGLSLMIFVVPCKAPYLGSLLLTDEQCLPIYEKASNIIFHLPLILATLLLHMQAIVRTYIYSGYVHMAGSAFLWLEILNLLKMKKKYNGTDFRSIQIFENLLNSCIRRRIFPLVAGTITLLQILACFAIIRGISTASFISRMIYINATNNSLIVNISIFTMAGKIFSRSKQWIEEAMKKGTQNKIKRRVIKSFAPLRLRLKDNFADELTCLVVQNFCIVQTVSLLLVASK